MYSQAFNEVGAGPVSEPKVIYSAEDMPQVSPQQVSALSYNSTSLNVSWVPIDQSREMLRGKLIGHRVNILLYSIIKIYKMSNDGGI